MLFDTRAGRVHTVDSGGGPAVLCLHGNSASSKVFGHQTGGAFGDRYRVVTLDLPGHGGSDDASNPETDYSIPGYADAVMEASAALGLRRPVLFGWSLGGHVAMEMVARGFDASGCMIVASPPIGHDPDHLGRAFRPTPAFGLSFQEVLDDREAAAYARFGMTADAPPPSSFVADVVRADGQARRCLGASVQAGHFSDEVKLVRETDIPFAVVTGRDEPYVENDYLASLEFATLWRREIVSLDGCGHMPFFERPEAFNRILGAFLEDAGS